MQSSSPEILSFLSSFLRDILQLAVDIKKHTYTLIGIQPPPQKTPVVHPNIYSIMEACHQSFEDFRRTETLLRGHVKGKLQAENQREMLRQSRSGLQGNSRVSRDVYLKKINQEQQKILANKYGLKAPKGLNKFVPQYSDQMPAFYPQQQHEEPRQHFVSNRRTLYESRSHGQLISKRYSPPASEASQGQTQAFNIHGPVGLINKIRQELGLLTT